MISRKNGGVRAPGDLVTEGGRDHSGGVPNHKGGTVAIRFRPHGWDTTIPIFFGRNPAEPKLQKLLADHGVTLKQLADIINPADWEGVTFF